MICAINLLWIIPLSMAVGFLIAAICAAGRDRNND